MNETLFPVGILLQYSWAPFLASSSFFPAIEWLVSRTMMCWNSFASACFSATSVILKTASTLKSYEEQWLISVLTGRVILLFFHSCPCQVLRLRLCLSRVC